MLRVLIFTILLSTLRTCFCTFTYNLTIHGASQDGYFTTVLFGTPPQEINLLLDTGSSNIAVACVPTLAANSKYFHFNDSTSLHPFDIAVDLRYVVGRWNGFLAKEYMHFSNRKLPCTLACMDTIDKIFDESSQFQGLLGLAYPNIAIPDPTVLPFMTVLTEAENISDIFSLDLCGPYYTSKEQWTQCGKFQLGFVSDTYKPDEIVYTPLYKEWYYEVILTDFKVGMKDAPFHCLELNKGKSIIDSGTTDLYLPHAAYEWAIHQIRSLSRFPKENWTDDINACVSDSEFHIESLPSITLSFYHEKDSVFDLVITPDLYLLPVVTYKPNILCFKLALDSSDEGVIVGSSILRGFYVVFDRENRRIGFANSSYLNDQNKLPGLVIKPENTNENMEWCFKKEKFPPSDISTPMIVLLFFSVLVAIILLYMLVSWIYRHFSIPNRDSLETNNLVYDDEYL